MIYSENIVKHYASTNKERFDKLTPETSRLFSQLVRESLSKYGVLLSFYSGYRPEFEQWELRKKYLAGGALAAKPGESWHQYRRAGDSVIITPEGEASFNHPQFKNVVSLAKSIGLKWGGKNDTPHFYNDKNTSLWLLKNQSDRWQVYDNLEQGLGMLVKSDDIYPVLQDSKIIVKKTVVYLLLGSVAAYGLYKLSKYVRTP